MPLRAKVIRSLCKIENKGMALNGRLYKVDEKKCMKCGKCYRNCPVNNIAYENGKFHFGGNCLGCARCAFSCPTDAINTGVLNFMKVNGEYDFNTDFSDVEIPKFCNKSYREYFMLEKKND